MGTPHAWASHMQGVQRQKRKMRYIRHRELRMREGAFICYAINLSLSLHYHQPLISPPSHKNILPGPPASNSAPPSNHPPQSQACGTPPGSDLTLSLLVISAGHAPKACKAPTPFLRSRAIYFPRMTTASYFFRILKSAIPNEIFLGHHLF